MIFQPFKHRIKQALLLFGLFVLTQVTWSNNRIIIIAPAVIEKIEAKYGQTVANRFVQWQQLVDRLQGQPEDIQLQGVNDFFNRAQWVSDQNLWKRADYWASPIEFLILNAGDCEDFSVAKYFTLKALGISDRKLYLSYVTAIEWNEAHMVLTYFPRPKAIPLVLDNIDKQIKKASLRHDLRPVFSFNGEGLWKAKSLGKGREIPGGTRKLKGWQDLMTRMQI